MTARPRTLIGSAHCGLLLGMFIALPVLAQQSKPAEPPSTSSGGSSAAAKAMAEHKGIWKWVVPPVRMRGMYEDHDPIGLVAGKLIPADCAFNWTDPDTHKLYCFTTATSLVYFLDAPQTYLAQADKNWRQLKARAGQAR
jgi:hypothetical protein